MAFYRILFFVSIVITLVTSPPIGLTGVELLNKTDNLIFDIKVNNLAILSKLSIKYYNGFPVTQKCWEIKKLIQLQKILHKKEVEKQITRARL